MYRTWRSAHEDPCAGFYVNCTCGLHSWAIAWKAWLWLPSVMTARSGGARGDGLSLQKTSGCYQTAAQAGVSYSWQYIGTDECGSGAPFGRPFCINLLPTHRQVAYLGANLDSCMLHSVYRRICGPSCSRKVSSWALWRSMSKVRAAAHASIRASFSWKMSWAIFSASWVSPEYRAGFDAGSSSTRTKLSCRRARLSSLMAWSNVCCAR